MKQTPEDNPTCWCGMPKSDCDNHCSICGKESCDCNNPMTNPNEKSDTPECDEAQQRLTDYDKVFYENFVELSRADNAAKLKDTLANRPPDGWDKARSIERRLSEAKAWQVEIQKAFPVLEQGAETFIAQFEALLKERDKAKAELELWKEGCERNADNLREAHLLSDERRRALIEAKAELERVKSLEGYRAMGQQIVEALDERDKWREFAMNLGKALNVQDERWGLYTNESQEIRDKFNLFMATQNNTKEK